MTGIGQVAFAHDANGSLVDVTVSRSAARSSDRPGTAREWFYGRPSAVGDDASTSSGSNLGPRSQQLADDIETQARQILKIESPYTPGLTTANIPVDLVTSSGSGLDPDISVAAARFQAPRIAAVRGLPLDQVLSLIDAHTAHETLGFLGEPRVNVLELNLALQGVAPRA